MILWSRSGSTYKSLLVQQGTNLYQALAMVLYATFNLLLARSTACLLQKNVNYWVNILQSNFYTSWSPTWLHWCGRYHQEPSSQLITLKSQIFLVKNSNLQSSGLVGLVAKSSVFKPRQFWNLLSSHLRFWMSFNLLSPQGHIFGLPKNPVTPPTDTDLS